MRSISRSIVPALVGLCLLAVPVDAAPGSAVRLTLLRNGTDLSEIGWSATGAITDSGDWTTDGRVFGGSAASNAFVVAEVLTTELGSHGSFHVRFQGLENRQISFSGSWQLVDGSGAYAGFVGTGTWFLSIDQATGNLVFNLSGAIH
jgi:hypothetical protein